MHITEGMDRAAAGAEKGEEASEPARESELLHSTMKTYLRVCTDNSLPPNDLCLRFEGVFHLQQYF